MGALFEYAIRNRGRSLALGLAAFVPAYVFFAAGLGVSQTMRDPWTVELWLRGCLTTAVGVIALLGLCFVCIGVAPK